MSLQLNESQLRWVMEKAENPTKRMLNIYFEKYDKTNLKEWCRINSITQQDIPSAYTDYANITLNDHELSTYPERAGKVKYFHRAAGWNIWLELLPEGTEWDDEMVAKDIKPILSQMLKSAEIILGLLALKYKNLLGTMSLKLDDKNLTLILKDSRFPDMNLPIRMGFFIEKIRL
jgi:hypothetical protein